VSIDLPTGILVPKHLRDTLSITELCELYGISRKIGYKWIDRYLRQGPAGFEERSRRPRGSPNATSEEIVAAILEEIATGFGTLTSGPCGSAA
jgi:transposase